MSKDLIVAILLLAAFLAFTAFRIYVNRKKNLAAPADTTVRIVPCK